MKAFSFRKNILSIPNDEIQDYYVQVFDSKKMQDHTENCSCPDLVGVPLRIKLNFTFPLQHKIELSVMEDVQLCLQLISLSLLETMSNLNNFA